MADIGKIIREVEVVPLEAPVEPEVNPDRTPDREETPSRELEPAGAPSGQLSSVRGEMVPAGLSAKVV